MPSKNYTLFFILSVGFVLVSIAFITILGQTSSADSGSRDLRAKATVQNSLLLTGVIGSISGQTFTLNSVRFDGNDAAQPMGSFTATLGPTVQLGDVRVGQTVLVAVDASSFKAAEKTFTVLSVSKR